MDTSVLKFIKYLKEQLQETRKNLILLDCLKNKSSQELEQYSNLENKLIILQNFIEILETPRVEWSRSSWIFNDFDILSNYLEISPLNAKETMDIIFYFIIKNLSTNLLESQTLIVDSITLDHYPFKKITKAEVEKILYKDGIHTLLKKEITNLTLEDYEKQQEFLEFVENHCVSIEKFAKQHQIIQIHYLDKLTYFNESDIKEVIVALQTLKVSKNITEKINNVLKQKYQKRNKQLTTKNVLFTWKPQNASAEKFLTDKEYKQIKKELHKYYNIRNNQVTHPLSFEEMIECISLLLKLDMDRSQIEAIITKIEISRKQNQTDPFSRIEEELKRLKFYEQTGSITEKIQNIEQSLEEIKNTEDQSERSIWRKILIEELTNLKEFLAKDKRYKNYEYEISCAKNLLKIKKEKITSF